MPADLKVLTPGYGKAAEGILKDLYEQAQKGEIIEFTAVYRVKSAPKDVVWSWSGCDNLKDLIGELEIMKQRMVKRLFEGK